MEQRARAVAGIVRAEASWDALRENQREQARVIARAEIEREGRLVDALTSTDPDVHEAAIAAYEAEFAPKERTVEQIAADTAKRDSVGSIENAQVVSRVWLAELAAALKRGQK